MSAKTPSDDSRGFAANETTLHVRQAAAGEATSVAWLVEHLHPLLVSHADYRLRELPQLRQDHDAEDLAQRVWAIALPRLGDLRERAGRMTPVLLSFLGTALMRTCSDLLRRHAIARRRHFSDPHGDDEGDPLGALPRETTAVLSKVARRERARAIAAAIASLPQIDREILILRGLEGAPYALLATKLERGEGALRVRYHAALEHLRGVLPQSLFEDLEGSGPD